MKLQMDKDHPIRRFITPFTFNTIGVNDNARNNLTAPRTMAARCFAFDEKGTQLAWAACPSLIRSGFTRSEEGLLNSINRSMLIQHLKEARGIDTPYYRWNLRFWDIVYKFVEQYVEAYYGDLENIADDPQVVSMMGQYLSQMEFTSPADSSGAGEGRVGGIGGLSREFRTKLFLSILCGYINLVTSGHEQVGAVAPYVQDVSFCAFKWLPDQSVGTKQVAIAQGLLMAFTSTPMPLLMRPLKDDAEPWEPWTHLFPSSSTLTPKADKKKAEQSFEDFQNALQGLSREMDAHDEKFPNEIVYCFNPKHLETSVSV